MDINDSKNNRKVLIVGAPATCISDAIVRIHELETIDCFILVHSVHKGIDQILQERSFSDEFNVLASNIPTVHESLFPQKMEEFVSLNKRKKGHERPYRYHP